MGTMVLLTGPIMKLSSRVTVVELPCLRIPWTMVCCFVGLKIAMAIAGAAPLESIDLIPSESRGAVRPDGVMAR